jgi:hypothetical protein
LFLKGSKRNNIIWANFTEEEQKAILDSERSNNYLDTSKLEFLFPDTLHIKDAVRQCLLKYSINKKEIEFMKLLLQ